jgi:heme-degrading monooxygenase HmoA
MIIAHVRFPVPAIDRAEFEQKLQASVVKYEKLDGLIRKYYVLTEDGKTAGGIYLWESKAKAEAWYNADWHRNMTTAWGQPPMLEYLDCPIVVDCARVHSRISA